MSLIALLIFLAVVAIILSWIPMDPLFKKICYLVVGVAILVVLLRVLFPGVI